ncbi:hypothetical protein P879_01868 [Paragonimus westermani]|uniref:Uncharacterized protein n=1 Tax=Paragonimus westermani TaxID=34504 RepID=A0A8T0DXI3_9TREM|nr:hypothetical protein P879_01868 [Paragonimus westermani]
MNYFIIILLQCISLLTASPTRQKISLYGCRSVCYPEVVKCHNDCPTSGTEYKTCINECLQPANTCLQKCTANNADRR